MDNYLLELQYIAISFALIILYKVWWNGTFKSFNSKHKQPPLPFFALPVIGHFHLFLNGQSFHHNLGAMANKLGPAFIAQLGSRRTLVISSWEVAKECFTINDKALFSRASNTAAATNLCYKAAVMGKCGVCPWHGQGTAAWPGMILGWSFPYLANFFIA